MQIFVDKIASVTKNVGLKHTLQISAKIVSAEGYILVVEALKNKKIYNQLELTSGRLSTIHKEDILAVALGRRRALKGFVGEIPDKLKVGDTIHILNLGGVAGICTSENVAEVGHALKVKVLGAVVDEQNRPLTIHNFKLFKRAAKIKKAVPLVIVSGTGMSTGKTSVACEIIKSASRKGYKVHSAKLAGIAALKDIKNMQDHGARKAVSMIDAGYTSTIISAKESVEIAKGAINYLAQTNPDFIVIEFGDGILGEYGVLPILKDREIQKNIGAHVGCAHDPVGALKLAEICQKLGTPLHVVSGPVTDNSIGTEFISKNLKIIGINALYHGEKLFPFLSQNFYKKR